jgi:methionyl aminopeptidase
MDEEIAEKYRHAGRVAAEVREFGKGLIKDGVRFVTVAEAIEKRIKDQGCGIAFPVNLSRNDIAAHYSPRHDDVSIFHNGDLIKVDVGVHVDGYIADTASTIEVGTTAHSKLIEASETALKNAIAKVREHAPLSVVGKTIEETIQSYGYKSVDNLTGHSMTRFALHAGTSVPNVTDESFRTMILHPGDVVAIEPFATDGAGHVISGDGSNIYLYQDTMRGRLLRDQSTRVALQKIKGSFTSLPFAQRWCMKTIPNADTMLKKLSFSGSLKHFPQLRDKNKGMVTQAEHTVIITDDGCEVTT